MIAKLHKELMEMQKQDPSSSFTLKKFYEKNMRAMK